MKDKFLIFPALMVLALSIVLPFDYVFTIRQFDNKNIASIIAPAKNHQNF